MVISAASKLRTALADLTGTPFTIRDDFLNSKKNESADGVYEILVGNTNRAESAAASEGLDTYDYIIKVAGTKIVIAGGSDYAIVKATEAFLSLFAGGSSFTFPVDLELKGKAETGDFLVGLTNQGASKVEIYDFSTGRLDETSLVWSVSLPYYNIAGLKLRRHEVWGEVAIVACGSSYASIITYPEGKTVWSTNYAANNPHSVELIPGDIFVVASSTGGALRFFDLLGESNKYIEVNYPDAHGVLWDPENQLLWALGEDMLRAFAVERDSAGTISVTEITERRSTAPTGGGHDLAPVYGDTNQLWVTTNSAVYRYDKTTKEFTSFDSGIITKSVKGIGNFADGSVVAIAPDGVFKSWTSATVNFYIWDGLKLNPLALKSSNGAFYKCRVWSTDYQ
jgi:hypothetical protein